MSYCSHKRSITSAIRKVFTEVLSEDSPFLPRCPVLSFKASAYRVLRELLPIALPDCLPRMLRLTVYERLWTILQLRRVYPLPSSDFSFKCCEVEMFQSPEPSLRSSSENLLLSHLVCLLIMPGFLGFLCFILLCWGSQVEGEAWE